MKKFLLLISIILVTHANGQKQATNNYLDVVYSGSTSTSHVIDIHNNISNSLDLMVECDGHVSYCRVSDGGDTQAIVDFNSKGISGRTIIITILNVNSPSITLIIKKIK